MLIRGVFLKLSLVNLFFNIFLMFLLNLISELGVPWVTLLSMDSFYRVLNEKEHELANQNQHNFDHPDAFDFELLKETLQRLKEGKKVEVPIYNFVTHRREAKTTSMYGANVLIFEGILAFHDKVCY